MSTPLKLGFIGGSLHSAVGYAHYTSSKMDGLWELVTGCFSLDENENKQTGASYGVAPDRVYNRWQDLIRNEKDNIDALVILTPTPSHYELVVGGLNNGIPIICEKSLTECSRDAEKIEKILKAKNGFLAVTYNYSGYPMIRELKNIIEKGELGKLLHFQAEMPQEGYVRVDSSGNKIVPQKWRLGDKIIPTLHLDLAVHLHQLIYYLTKLRPLKVVSIQNSFGGFTNVIDNVNCLCQYSRDFAGQIWFSKSALGYRNGMRLRIFGSDASAEWLQSNPEELILSHKNGRREIVDRASSVEITNQKRYNRFKAGHPAGYVEAFANLYQDIADSILQYKDTGNWQSDEIFGIDLSLEGLRMLEAMVCSFKENKWETLRKR